MRRWLWLAVLAVGVGLLAAAELRPDRVSLPVVRDVEGRGTLEAPRQPFGDPVAGRLDVYVPRRSVDPESVRVDASFQPYGFVRPLARERFDDGETTLLRYRFVISCLEPACLPRHTDPGLVLPPAVVRYVRADGRPGAVEIGWPSVGTTTRLGRSDEGLFGWRTGLHPLPGQTYRLPPKLLALLLGALALACAAGSAATLLPRVRRAQPHSAEDRRSVLDRALAAVRNAATGDDTSERRRALDFLARELRTGARRGEAREARRLAWSRRSPKRRDMVELADRIERASAS